MRFHRCLLVSVAAGSLVTAVACSGGAGSSCGSYYDALVAYTQRCGSTTSLDASERSNFVDACNSLANAPGTNNLSGQIDSCTSELKSAACGGIPSCIIRGTLADGAACGNPVQCSGGRCANTQQSSATSEIGCGTCGAYAKLGDACGNTGAACDTSTGSCVNGTCTAYVAQGGACGSGQGDCATGLSCDSTQTCQPPPGKGEACTLFCQSPYACIGGTCADAVGENGACPTGLECASNLQCDFTTHTCMKPTTAKAGEACGVVNNQFVNCDSGLSCQNKVCVAPKKKGDACTVGKGECDVYLACVDSVCVVPDYSVCK